MNDEGVSTEADLLVRLQNLERQLTLLSSAAAPGAEPEAEEASLRKLSTTVEVLHAAADELQQAINAVSIERHRYRELATFAPDAYAVTDVDGILEEANAAAEALLGDGGESLAGKPLAEFLDDTTALHRRIASLRAGEPGPISWHSRVRRSDGSLLPVLIRAAATRDAAGGTLGFRWMLRETTGDDPDADSSAVLVEHNEQLAALKKTKSDFLSLASHELRSPLAIMQGYLSMSLSGDFGPMSPELNRALTMAFVQGRALSRLIDHMLDAARVSRQELELAPLPVDLREVVRDALQAPFHNAGRRDRRRVRLGGGDDPVPVIVDPARIAESVRNLVENALKYSPASAEVSCDVTVDTANQRALVVVNDRGVGIDDEAQALLFERFGRVVTSDTSHIFGTGLGLFLARQIARLHDGDVRLLETVPGAGSTFVLDLPLDTRAAR